MGTRRTCLRRAIALSARRGLNPAKLVLRVDHAEKVRYAVTCRYHRLIRSVSPRRPSGVVGRGWPDMPKKILTWGLIAFLVLFIAYRPASAATVFKQLGNSLVDVANGIGAFFSNLVA